MVKKNRTIKSRRRILPSVVALFLFVLSSACQPDRSDADNMTENDFARKRQEMVRSQLKRRGISDQNVLSAFEKVKRHLFVPPEHRRQAYNDQPLPIGEGQTISQPYIVALMTEYLALKPGMKVLEVGTGSGYQAAILGEIAGEVDTIEIVGALGKRARSLLDSLGYGNVHVKIGNGYKGW